MSYVRETPELLGTLLLLATMTMLAYAWDVTLAMLARDTFDGGARAFGLMLSAMGVGSIIGGLVFASRWQATTSRLLWSAAAFCGLLGVAVSPSLPIALALLVVLGVASISFRSLASSRVQILSAPHMRGRVVGLLAVASVGSKPIGTPVVGWVGDHMGPRAAIGLPAVATGSRFLLCVPICVERQRRPRPRRTPRSYHPRNRRDEVT